MPTASPSMSASAGCRRVELDERREGDGAAETHPDPEQGDEQGEARGDEAAEDDDEHEHGDAEPQNLAGPDEHGLLGDLEAVVRRDAGSREGRRALLRDQRPVRGRHRLRVLVEAHLGDGVPAVLADQPGALGRAGDGEAVLVLGAAGGELVLGLRQVGPTRLELRRAVVDLGLQLRDRRVVRVGGDELVEQCPAAGELELGLPEPGPALVELLLALGNLRSCGSEAVGGGVELLLRVEGVDDAGDVRQLLPRREHVPHRAALVVGELPLVALEDDAAEAAGRRRDLVTELVEHPLEGGAGDRHPAAEWLADGHGERPHAEEDDEPCGEHGPGVCGGPAGEAVQQGGHRGPSGQDGRRGSGEPRGCGRSGARGRGVAGRVEPDAQVREDLGEVLRHRGHPGIRTGGRG